VNRPVLYSFRRCPYAIRARLALRQAGLDIEIREIELRNKPAELSAASPKASVPVLLLPDGQVLEQSLDIMNWALAQHDPEGWLSAAPSVAQAALIDCNDGPFKALLDRYKYADRHPQATAAQWRDAAVELLLAPLEAGLQRGPFLLGVRCSLADMSLLPFVRQFAAVDSAWFEQASLPHLRRWLADGVSTPLFQAVMHKQQVWRSGLLQHPAQQGRAADGGQPWG